MFGLLLLSFNLIYHVYSINDCLDLNISLIRTIDRSGFHNKIKWMVEFLPSDLEELKRAEAKFALYIKIPSGMYVNPDEIDDLSRLAEYSVYIDGKVNVEAPENEAKPHDVFIFLPELYGDKVEIILPVHLRYQLAKIGGGFGKVHLSKPSLLMLTPRKSFKTCGDHLQIKAPCNADNLTKCYWSNISYVAVRLYR
ncbi:phosphatidylinositol-glycan biosynthesis class x protein [Holotrichia oblita]|uniref:Phosphatidylinositol-glycan biosynthesis class x protein n=1 Tax=Holotrichia oblita TaxID=644536 RepID=A0ACB9SUQ5_HOLOL|nr:phosphatidylinositol-glycan biosynthesis class x protein [Holotrichia oblita]